MVSHTYMNMKLNLTLTLILSLLTPALLRGENRIAVVESPYDNVALILKNYDIPYSEIKYRDLERAETYKKYDAIFMPSGMANSYMKNIDVQQSGKSIASVKLSDDFFELNEKKFSVLFKEFIHAGGSAYFSGYSFKTLNSVYQNFTFFENFPYLGIPERVEAKLKGDLANFSLKRNSALYMGYTGWVTMKSVSGAKILSQGEFETPLGLKQGPLSFIMENRGAIIYTSYYSTVYSEFKRFHIMRIAGNRVIQKILGEVNDNFQSPLTKISDKFLSHETSRMYLLDLEKGKNSIYIFSESSPFAFEIYSSNKNLMASLNVFQNEQRFDINSKRKDFCLVKIYPSSPKKEGTFAIVSAYGDFFSLKSWDKSTILIMATILILITALLIYGIIRIMAV